MAISNANVLLVVLAVLAILAVVVIAPLGLIWSLDILFGLAIPYTLKAWVAALVLLALTVNARRNTK